MSDLISRQAAIDALKEEVRYVDGYYCEHDAVINEDDAVDAINSLPAADVVERNTGTWKDYREDGFLECPYCRSATNCDGNADELHYCFSCGARLEVEKDGE